MYFQMIQFLGVFRPILQRSLPKCSLSTVSLVHLTFFWSFSSGFFNFNLNVGGAAALAPSVSSLVTTVCDPVPASEATMASAEAVDGPELINKILRKKKKKKNQI